LTSIRTPAPVTTCSASPFVTPTMLSTSPTPLEVQERIKAIEEEIRVLRAQSNNPTVGTTPNRSSKHPNASYSLSPPIQNIAPAPSTLNRSVQVSSTLRTPDHISSIVNPASFAYKGKLYQAILWTPKIRISSAPLIATTQTSPTPLISIRAPPDMPTTQISTFQPADTPTTLVCHPDQGPIVPQSPTPTLTASLMAMSTRISVPPTSTSTFALPSILHTIARLSLRSTLPYIRNHARLKSLWCDLGLK
jgi:hypothetical protein